MLVRRLCILVPLILLGLAVAFFAVNLPHWDEWDIWMSQLPKLSSDGLTWNYIWQKQNGHFLPLTWVAIALFSQLQLGPKAFMLFQTVVWSVNLWLFWTVFAAEKIKLSSFKLFLMSAFFLTFTQREVFFLAATLSSALVTTALFIFVLATKRERPLGKFAGVLLGFLSFSNWVCILPAWTLNRMRLRWPHPDWPALSAILIGICGALFIFLNDQPTGAQGTFSFIKAVGAFLRVLGNPFVMTGKYQNIYFHLVAMGLGIIFLALSWIYFLKNRTSTSLNQIPFLLVIYTLSAAALIAVSRGSEGLDMIGQASRYVGMIVPGWCGLFMLLLEEDRKWKAYLAN